MAGARVREAIRMAGRARHSRRGADVRREEGSRERTFGSGGQAGGTGVLDPARHRRGHRLILSLVKELAEYERLSHEVVAAEATLRDHSSENGGQQRP